MNSLTRLLVKEAAIRWQHQEDVIYTTMTIEQLEKFTELVIAECMECSLWVGKMNTNPTEPIQTARAINQRIRKRFEVKS